MCYYESRDLIDSYINEIQSTGDQSSTFYNQIGCSCSTFICYCYYLNNFWVKLAFNSSYYCIILDENLNATITDIFNAGSETTS